MAILSAPAVAADADQGLKMEAEKIAAAYAENFNQRNSAGIAALYATGGIAVNPTGMHTDIAQIYDGAFKAGFNHNQITVDQVWPLGPDALLAMGEYHITGQNPSGAAIEVKGIWTSTDVREGGTWKIRMLSAMPKAPPPKD
ncbi:nuclear transport factor 2 family protein [Bradyrhizobium sp.]|uniref:nuclear transport factor 2 family protein n=1 Tax=Bradyrhizobium sp. TaxID=376 RepID=UPI003C6ADA1F